MYSQIVLPSFRVSNLRDAKKSVKFMQVLDKGIFLKLKELARARGVTVQELIRVLIVPDWMRRADEGMRRMDTRRSHKRLKSAGGPATVQVAARAHRRSV